MNNLKKIGLTALAGSMVAVSAANAIEMTANGKMKITYVDEGEGSAGNTDVTGNPYGFEQAISFTASGETPLGTASTYFKHEAGSIGSSYIAIDMGDAGTVSLDDGYYYAGLITVMDVMPRAAGAEQSWDDVDGTNDTAWDMYNLANHEANNAFGYTNSIMGMDITASYEKNGGAANEDDGNADAGDDSNKSIVISNSSLVEGLTLGAGYGKFDDPDSEDIQKHSTLYAKYAIGPVVLGYQTQYVNEDDDDHESTLYGVSFNVNENISVSYNQRDVEIGDGSNGNTDQENTGIAASYTMGGMSLSAFNNKVDNVGGTAGTDDEVTQVTLSFSF